MMDARASVISNNLNTLMKNLNVTTIAMMLPTFFASLFGMNVLLPFGMGNGNGLAFWVVILISILSVFGFFLLWKHINKN
jgi:magnesium transporter